METTESPLLTDAMARLLYQLLVGSLIVLIVVLGVVGMVSKIEFPAAFTATARLVAFFLVAASMVLVQWRRQGISAFREPEDRDAWWQANAARILMIWFVCEGVATVCAVLWLLTGDLLVLGLGGLILLLLLLNRPGALMET